MTSTRLPTRAPTPLGDPADNPPLARARAVGIASEDRWPYGPYSDYGVRAALVRWAEHCGLRLASRAPECPHWLINRRPRDCGVCHGGRWAVWADHVTCWTKAGKPEVFVAQPYGLNTAALVDLAATADELGLDARVSGTGWYGYHTTFVGLWVRHAPPYDIPAAPFPTKGE